MRWPARWILCVAEIQLSGNIDVSYYWLPKTKYKNTNTNTNRQIWEVVAVIFVFNFC